MAGLIGSASLAGCHLPGRAEKEPSGEVAAQRQAACPAPEPEEAASQPASTPVAKAVRSAPAARSMPKVKLQVPEPSSSGKSVRSGSSPKSRKPSPRATREAVPEMATEEEPVEEPSAPAGPGQVSVKWSAKEEVNVQGYNILRSESPSGPWRRANSALMPAEGGPAAPHTYDFVDRDVKAGKKYYYFLEEKLDTGERRMISKILPKVASPAP